MHSITRLITPLALLGGSFLGVPLVGQLPAAPDTARPSARAVTVGGPILVDGRLDEESWSRATPASDFRQREPFEGRPASQRTEVRFAYDEEALYVGARMLDSLGAAGVRSRLARRDQAVEGDHLVLTFDSYHDHTGRTIFQVNPSGVKFDAGQGSPYADPAWDPVWQVATRTDSAGWTAEMRIPFSQIRFSADPDQTWGLQIERFVERLNERSMWSFWEAKEAGGPALYGHLEGLRVASRPRGLELMPYTLSRAAHVPASRVGDPLHDPRKYGVRAGLDVKALLTSNLTLSATINPDFGQVEVDPAQVNLSAFETYYQERRPFFVEGGGLLSFGGLWCRFCSNVEGMSLFYSRRIGRHPQGTISSANRFSSVPLNSAILGAAKITGRTSGGWELGFLDAVTRSERAVLIDAGGTRHEREVEPLSNYFMGRVRRTFADGNAVVGAMVTSVARRISYDSLALTLPRHAEAAGVDWNFSWGNRAYSLMGNLAASTVSGDSAAILRLQRSPARYFHRPDREHGSNGLFSDRYDPGMGTLRGHGGYVRLAKGAGDWQWEGMVNYRSPGFEVNDMAFLQRAGYTWMNANVSREWSTPTRWFRRASLMTGAQQQYSWDGDLTDRQGRISAWGMLPNYWTVNGFVIERAGVYDERLTRGGPVVRLPGGRYVSGNVGSDSRRPVVLNAGADLGRGDDGKKNLSLRADARIKPASNVAITLGPSYSRGGSSMQFVRSFQDPAALHFHGQRVVFASLDQRTFALNTRLNVTFTPDLTLELFAQPYVATGDYSRFREFEGTRTVRRTEFDDRQLGSIPARDGRDSVYTLDADRNPETPGFAFGNPDFTYRSLRGSAVLRWEYRPGSTLFFVWQQQRSGGEPHGEFSLARDPGALFRDRGENVFVIKATYWIGR